MTTGDSIQPPDRRAEALEAIERAEAERPRARPVVNVVVLVTGGLTFTMAAWSAGHLVAQIPGVPTAYSWTAFAAIEGAWLACVLLMMAWQDEVERLFQFARAERLAKQVYWASLVLNFAHGLLLVGTFEVLPALLQPGERFDAALTVAAGAGAGLLLCVFPYVFKELFAVAVSNRVDELRALRLDGELQRRYRMTALGRLWPDPQDRARPSHAAPDPAPSAPSPDPTGTKARRVAQVAELLQRRPSLTARELAERLGCSLTSARRYRREARRAGQPERVRPALASSEQPPERDEQPTSAPPEQEASTPSTPPARDEQPRTLAEHARELLAQGASKAEVAARILEQRPDANPSSVKAEVRRQARKLEAERVA